MDIKAKYNNYNENYSNIVKVLNDIIESSEITEGSKDLLDEAYTDYSESYVDTKYALENYKEDSIQSQIKSIEDNKLGINKNEIIKTLTDGGINNTIYLDDDGRLFIDGEYVPELQTVKLTVDEQNKTIEALVSDGYVEVDGENVKLNLAYSKLKQTVNGIETTVADVSGNVDTLSGNISKISQKADKIFLLVTEDSTQSSLVITPELIAAIASSDIKLAANNIALEGYTTINGNFAIDTEGNMTAKNGTFSGKITAESGEISSNMIVEELNVDGDISADTLTVREIKCNSLVSNLQNDLDLYINSESGSDSANLENGAIFESLQGCIDAIPRFLNGNTINITLQTDLNENVKIRGFNSGSIYIKMNNKNILGTINAQDCSSRIFIYGGLTVSDIATGVDSVRPCIKPSSLISADTYYYSIYVANCNYVMIRNIDIYGKTDKSANYAIGGAYSANVYVQNDKVIGSYNGIQMRGMARCTEQNTYGKVIAKGHRAIYGGTIYINDGTMINGTIEHSNCAQIIYDSNSVTADGTTTSVGNNTNTTTSTETIVIKASYADTYRSTVYNSWKKDNTARQGDYGYGDCTGLWFFGSQFETQLKGKTIKKITVKVTRKSGGVSSSVAHTLRMHNYSSRPSGAPSFVSGWTKTFNAAVGDTVSISITDSALLDAISNGNVKGFGVRSTYDSSHYSVLSADMTVTATVQ